VAIHAKINGVLGQGATGCSISTQCLGKQSCADSSDAPPEQLEIEVPNAIDDAILQMLDQQPFTSLCL
jgi:hypothetical protein